MTRVKLQHTTSRSQTRRTRPQAEDDSLGKLMAICTPRHPGQALRNISEVMLRFSAGPPYEDVAFKIVNREWNLSHKPRGRTVVMQLAWPWPRPCSVLSEVWLPGRLRSWGAAALLQRETLAIQTLSHGLLHGPSSRGQRSRPQMGVAVEDHCACPYPRRTGDSVVPCSAVVVPARTPTCAPSRIRREKTKLFNWSIPNGATPCWLLTM